MYNIYNYISNIHVEKERVYISYTYIRDTVYA